MTVAEFIIGRYAQYPHQYTLKDGSVLSGIISAFFINETDNYYFVPGYKMQKFKSLRDANDYEAMKKLCTPVGLDQIDSAIRF